MSSASSTDVRTTLAPGVADLAALGAPSAAALWGGAALEDEDRLERLDRGPGWELVRHPLPGTPRTDDGPLTASPRGSGTGWVRTLRFEGGPWRARFGARFRHPRSGSLAERRWNVVCLLRGAGVVTPEPLAVVAEAAPFVARRSALVWREPDAGVPLLDALRSRRGTDRHLVLDALGRFAAHLAASGVEVIGLEPRRLLVLGEGGTQPESANDACALEQVLAARTGPRPAPVPGMSWREVPEVLLADVLDGRTVPARTPDQVAATLRTWATSAPELTRADRLRVWIAASPGLDPATGRRLAR